jgi:hypothetical protein
MRGFIKHDWGANVLGRVDVKPVESLSLFVRFRDGMTGEVRFAPDHLTEVSFDEVCGISYSRGGDR